MTYLLLQTFLLLLSAYFAGALCGCLAKRALMTRSPDMAAVAARTSPANYVEPPDENIPLIRPREIDPVQPRIEVFPRPARKEFAVTDKLDISRFERALVGPDPNEGMPRKMIVQIRPAVLKPVTGPAQPFKKPEPKVEAQKVVEPSKPVAAKTDAPKIEPAKTDAAKTEPIKPVSATPAPPAKSEPVKPEPSKAEAAAAQAAANIAAAQKSASTPAAPAAQAAEKPKAEPPKDPGAPSQGASPMMAGIAGASAAAAAAVAAAKAAAAAVVPRAVPSSPQQQKPAEDLKPAEPAKPAASTSATVSPPGPATPAATASAKQATAVTPAPVELPSAKPQPASPIAAVVKPDVTKPDVTKPDVTETLAKAVAPQPSTKEPETARAPAGQDVGHAHAATPGDDLQRIRAIDAETMRRLADISINSFEQIAHWTPADVNRVDQALGLAGRVDREQWIEQAQILAKGGETYYSRNRAAATKSPAAPSSAAPTQAQPVQPKPAQTAPVQTAAAQPTAPATQTSVPSIAKPKDVAPVAAVQAPPAAAVPSAVPAAAAPAVATPAPQAPSAQTPPAPQVDAGKPAGAAPPVAASLAAPQQTPASTTAGSALQGKSVAEMAAAAAAAIAAASASVTRGIRPIEPISPLTRANPNIVMPAKLSDALKDNESKAPAAPSTSHTPAAPQAKPGAKPDDLKRIRGIGVLIEKRLNALGITTYAEIANWNSADIDRISQTLEFKGRIERESWVEHARILASGGQTEFSRRVDRGDVESSRDDS